MTFVASPDHQLADIVNDDLRTASVFESFGLDYCCNGHQTLSEACAAPGAPTAGERLRKIGRAHV